MTNQEYLENLKRIAAGNPGEPLLNDLRTGHTRINEIYMRSALRRLDSLHQGDVDDEPDQAPDDTLRDMWRKRKELFGRMNKESNRFHQCSTDAERKAVSCSILSIWKQITRVKQEIAHYEATRTTLPDEPEKFPIPENPVALVKKLASARSRISQLKKELDELATLPDHHPTKAADIEKKERELQERKLYATTLEKAVQGAAVH